ncbi:MAG: hypothetical protein J4G15_16800 [Alphaproteobacteria bacterium]|nr:hypothetical protein [Alphaproteobacteria bacterium]
MEEAEPEMVVGLASGGQPGDGHQAAPLSAVLGKGFTTTSATSTSLHSLSDGCKASRIGSHVRLRRMSEPAFVEFHAHLAFGFDLTEPDAGSQRNLVAPEFGEWRQASLARP